MALVFPSCEAQQHTLPPASTPYNPLLIGKRHWKIPNTIPEATVFVLAQV